MSAPTMLRALTLALFGLLLLVATGCQDDPFCFVDCELAQITSGSGGAGGGNGVGGSLFSNSSSGGGGGGECMQTNGGNEICDNQDNDCDGTIDEDVDLDSIQTCGTCDNNCFTQLINADPTTITCTWDGMPGNPGVCAFTACAADYFDIDPNTPGCEYYCIQTATDDSNCNNKDDDCDGVKDENVNLCTDAQNCGSCGSQCTVVHGTGQCVSTQMMNCTQVTSHCEILQCDDDDTDTLPDWHDLDGSYATGCEYNCETTNGGVEICGDALDNDCDGAIDGSDSDLSGDMQLNQPCFGDPDGLCADPMHVGSTVCVGQQVLCQGANVLFENDVPETCNGIDDDCDGTIDDSPSDVGGSCGMSNVFPCVFGTIQCVGGMATCVGAINPQTETCNGIDDDCDGQIDLTNGMPPSDSVGPCNVPIPPPPNVTTPCLAGQLACQAGIINCVGWVGPSDTIDHCGDDSNCDGMLTNQPDLQTDVAHCGMCNNDCTTLGNNAVWTCSGGMCQFGGCLPGWYDLDSNQDCEYPCSFTGSEVCDNSDNDCDGQIDEGLTPPPLQVCGVSPQATRPECTTLVQRTCTNGTWVCTFPMGVCNPNCQSAVEICDNLDNNCNGGFNENVSNFGQACASDQGLPPPGHGACRTFGTYVCNGPNNTICSAVKASCTMLPGGCDERCDDIDNDCDGLVDEDYTFKGTDPTYFIKPAVTRIASGLWMMSYEASRPSATSTSAGTGNGYHCASNCGPLPPAPMGEVLDQTIACSAPGDLPWFNVNGIEAEQTCDEIGGHACTLTEWQAACQATQACQWGYNPRGAPCTSVSTGSKYCNLGPFDFNTMLSGDQDGLLPCGSPLLQNCWADWSNLQGNTTLTNKIFDLTGNLREITKNGSNVYPVMGGAFVTPNEFGATCDFDFFVVDQYFKLLDTGFRCCFSADPTL